MSNIVDFAEELKARTKKLAISVILYYKKLPKTEEAKVIGRQLLRSSTSIAANYRALCRARSDAEFYSKICIVVEEADETVFWLEIIKEINLDDSNETDQLLAEANEILKIMAASKKKAGLSKFNHSTTQ
ncbi:MAG TPA: four helix bundle protein [Chitinophagales bacterium]|nr:four helix bundle protein [Chitinophagales bacterium]